MNALWLGGRPLWNWYADLVQKVKSPAQGLARTISLAQGWLGDKQFKDLIRIVSTTNFSKIGSYLEMSLQHLEHDSTCNMDSFVEELFFYVLSLLDKRASSLSKVNLPPDVYAGLNSGNEDVA